MMGIGFRALALVALAQCLGVAVGVLNAAQPYVGQQVVQVLGADTPDMVATVEQIVQEVFMKQYRKGGLTALVGKEQIKDLEGMGFEVNVLIEDLADSLTQTMGEDVTESRYRSEESVDISDEYFTSYHNYQTVYKYLEAIVNIPVAKGVNPTWIQKKIIGKTLERRPMYAIEVGNPKAKYAVYLEGNIHAREWIAGTSAQYITREWLQKYANATDPELFNTIRFAFVPFYNVDGYRHSYLGDRLWRKNRRSTVNTSCVGVDLNRNFNGFDSWTYNPDECMNTYAGLKPFSEPETQNVVRYLKDMKKKYTILGALDLHSYEQSILWPYGYALGLPDPPNMKALDDCGKLMARAIKETTGKVYTVSNSANGLYAAAGAADDYFYDQVVSGPWPSNKGLAYTVEMRPDSDDPLGFVLPAEQILPGAREMLAGFNQAAYFAYKAVKGH